MAESREFAARPNWSGTPGFPKGYSIFFLTRTLPGEAQYEGFFYFVLFRSHLHDLLHAFDPTDAFNAHDDISLVVLI